MNRYNAFTIGIKDWANSDFWQLLSEHSEEDVLFDIQPEYKIDGVFWFIKVPKELFKFSECFDWLSGSTRLWHNNNPVTKHSYRTKMCDVEPTEELEGEFHYEYLPYMEMTDIQPISDDVEIY